MYVDLYMYMFLRVPMINALLMFESKDCWRFPIISLLVVEIIMKLCDVFLSLVAQNVKCKERLVFIYVMVVRRS